jgi:hypothetical protein
VQDGRVLQKVSGLVSAARSDAMNENTSTLSEVMMSRVRGLHPGTFFCAAKSKRFYLKLSLGFLLRNSEGKDCSVSLPPGAIGLVLDIMSLIIDMLLYPTKKGHLFAVFQVSMTCEGKHQAKISQ